MKKAERRDLVVGSLGAVLGLIGVMAFNRYIVMSLPLASRMVSMILSYWLIALLPIIIIIVNKEKLMDYGFSKDNIWCQTIAGVLIGLGLSLTLTLIPHLLGFGSYVDSGKRYRYLWQFAYEFLYCIIAVGLVEEFVFRGFIYTKIKRIGQKDMIAIIGSSVLFGLFHIIGGNVIQMVITACLGLFFCFCKIKIKNCSVLSLIIAHGIYDALITVWATFLL